jgi:hypothetical protein
MLVTANRLIRYSSPESIIQTQILIKERRKSLWRYKKHTTYVIYHPFIDLYVLASYIVMQDFER